MLDSRRRLARFELGTWAIVGIGWIPGGAIVESVPSSTAGSPHLTQEQLRADRDRHNWLTENDWTLPHFTDIDVYRRHARMVATVRRLLDREAA